MSNKPFLIIVVDTEEEFDWSAPFSRDGHGTTSLPELALLQECAAAHGAKPCYIMTYPVLRALAQESRPPGLLAWDKSDACDLGTHLHPWVTPPFSEVLSFFTSFAGNLPRPCEHAKLVELGRLFEEVVGRQPKIYKAGRYGFGPNTAALLKQLGYAVDLSIIGGRDLRMIEGPDMRMYPSRPFRFPNGMSAIPMSAGVLGWLSAYEHSLRRIVQSRVGRALRTGAVLARSRAAEWITVSPEGMPLEAMQRMTTHLISSGHSIITLSLHSPSLSPGCSPYVQDRTERDALVQKIHDYLTWFTQEAGGHTTSVSGLLARPERFELLSV